MTMSNTNKALLVVAHGSRREASNDEVRCLSKLIEQKCGERYQLVKVAFLELADPSIPNGIEECIKAGAGEVVVMPYFLSAGRHVATDIPQEVAPKQQQYPDIIIRIAPYLGAADGIAELMLQMSEKQDR
jgi:sirohydrochlorin ferrochelatase